MRTTVEPGRPKRPFFEEDDVATILGSIFEDRITSTLFVTFWKMPADVQDDLGYFGTYAKNVGGFWMLKSTDEGRTWSEPYLIQPESNAEGWVAWPNNCIHGIQLATDPHRGRLVIPAFHYKEGETAQVPGVRGGLLYSDDSGSTWRAGAVLRDGSDEVSLVETNDKGEIYVTHRMNTNFTGHRHFARSVDGGLTFNETGAHTDLPDPRLHAGLIRCGETRRMTIASRGDSGHSWEIGPSIDENLSRYSDLAATPGGTVLCVYTNGTRRDRDKVSVARLEPS